MLLLYILRKEEELLVLKYIYVTTYFIFLTSICRVIIIQLMRMLYMHNVLKAVSLYCTNNNVDAYVLGGDFNTALNRETSRHTIALNKFVYRR